MIFSEKIMTDKKDLHLIVHTPTKRAFGDLLLASYFTAILNDNGIDAYFYRRGQGREWIYPAIACNKIYDTTDPRLSTYSSCKMKYYHGEPGVLSVPIIEQYCNSFKKRYGISLKNNFNYIPVKYYDMPQVPSVDVTLCTKSGAFCPYRNWPYFKELKKLFQKNGISYIDLTQEQIYSIEYLNYVKKSKLFVGVDTGPSHYVSQVANGKALILQHGVHDINFWCSYDYDSLHIPTDCRLCKANMHPGNECKHNHICMRELTVDMVFNKIMEKL
jgi:hypothetical protein